VTGLCTSVGRHGYTVDLVAGYDHVRDASLILPDVSIVRFHPVTEQRFLGIPIASAFYRSVSSLAWEAKQDNIPVLVHDHGIWSSCNVAAAIASRGAGTPYILSPRGMLEPWALSYKSNKKHLAWALYQRRIVRSSAALVATSDQERDNIKNIAPDLPVAVIPNGVTWPAQLPDRSVRQPGRQASLLFMSRVHPKKNLLSLVRAWHQVCRASSRDHWTLQIAGPDQLDHTHEVRNYVHSLNLDSRVEFLGPIDEDTKGVVFASADLFVLPSFSENFGMVVAEALAYGLPVVATRGTPWASLAERGCGWWVEPTAEALAVALSDAVDLTAADRHVMGLKGREYVRTAFSWDGIGLMTAQLYDYVLGLTSSVPHFVFV
jgi:glycosyltransferase involved in cell wall biosynthesis